MGERIGQIGRIETDFLGFFHGFQTHVPPKNPFQSAQSAQSVLPLYHIVSQKHRARSIGSTTYLPVPPSLLNNLNYDFSIHFADYIRRLIAA
jgi:hypothetical protein